MQHFDRGGKFNWIDENNVVLGYDSGQDCCENAGWFLADKVLREAPENNGSEGFDWTPWRFDPEFFENVEDGGLLGGGGMVAFRIVNGHSEMFLHIFNDHNGYYSHGFDFKSESTNREGTL